MFTKDSHCSYCGQSYENAEWPRRCTNCSNMTFRNPIPVAVVVQPVDGGILLARRAIAPQIGKWALPGGYVDFGETWEEAAAREMMEETHLQIAVEGMKLINVLPSGNRATILIFGEAPEISKTALSVFSPNSEVSEIMVCQRDEVDAVDFAFPLHQEIARKWFEGN